MTTIEEYFEENRYNAKYEFGTRVFGYWNNIPFMGKIYGDSVISEEVGPQYSIHLDLPIKYKGKIYNILVDKQSNFKKIKPLTKLDL